jgi:hypothetical protein
LLLPGRLNNLALAMKLRYRNTIEDFVAFNRFFFARSPLVGRQARFFGLSYGLTMLGVSALFALTNQDAGLLCFGLVGGVVLGLLTYVTWRPLMIWQTNRNTRKFLIQHPDKTLLVEQELEIAGDELIVRQEYGEFRWKVSALEDIVETPDYVFLRISAMRAYVLPRDGLDPQELDSFLDDLERAYDRPERAALVPARSEAIQATRHRPWQQTDQSL